MRSYIRAIADLLVYVIVSCFCSYGDYKGNQWSNLQNLYGIARYVQSVSFPFVASKYHQDPAFTHMEFYDTVRIAVEHVPL